MASKRSPKQPAPTLHYETSGHGPTVVLLHGYLASSAYWHRTVEALATNHTVVSIDLLGFGQSPKPRHSRYDFDAQLASIQRTLQQAGVSGRFKLIGHSMGSLIALHFAASFPDQVSRLFLTNMPVFGSSREARREIYRTNAVYFLGLRASLHWLVWPLFKAASRRQSRRSAELANRQAYVFQNNAASRLRSLRNIIFAASVEADLESLSMPTVIISGLQDRARYLHNLASLQLNANIRLENVATGHHLPITHPQLIAERVSR